MIVHELHEIQNRCGYLPKDELKQLAERLEVELYEVQNVASFYPHFRSQRPAEVVVHVCRDMACFHRGGEEIATQLATKCKQSFGESRVAVHGVSCLGRCDRPVASVVSVTPASGSPREHVYASVYFDRLFEIVRQVVESRNLPRADRDKDYVACAPTPWMIDPYADGARKYESIRRYLDTTPVPRMGDDYAKIVSDHPIIKGLRKANLLGMGGAGVPAFQKWRDVAVAEGDEKYIVCNADESEPSTFKDRELLLRTPHLVLEGVILAGLLTGATKGYIYIRHEYAEQIERMKNCIKEAERFGVCGDRILKTSRNFPVEVFVSPGGYICGEQSALIEAMSDRRSEPRNRPPDLLTNGLYDKPTLVSNVETFAWVPAIMVRTEEGKVPGQWYAEQGRPGYQGRRFFSICGDLKRPGVYEVPIGITMRELIEEYAGGLPDGVKLVAIAPSGPSGGYLPPKIPVKDLPRGFMDKIPANLKAKVEGQTHLDILDLELDLNMFRNFGLMLGAGLAVYGSGTDVIREAVNATRFFRNESCGKCVPCRVGSQKLVDIGTNLLAAKYTAETITPIKEMVLDLGTVMELTSICGLGAVAPGPMTSIVKYFPDELKRYLVAYESSPEWNLPDTMRTSGGS